MKEVFLKGGKKMHSQLMGILKRLEAMVEAQDGEVQVRRFEKDGEERCVISYDSNLNAFELTESATHQSYQFDNMDLVAMEIYAVYLV